MLVSLKTSSISICYKCNQSRKQTLYWVTLFHHLPVDNIIIQWVHLYSLPHLFTLLFDLNDKLNPPLNQFRIFFELSIVLKLETRLTHFSVKLDYRHNFETDLLRCWIVYHSSICYRPLKTWIGLYLFSCKSCSRNENVCQSENLSVSQSVCLSYISGVKFSYPIKW